jgi:hypothetical protein
LSNACLRWNHPPTSCTDTPEQNGVAERKHRHIVETARSLLLSAFVPSEFWGEVVLTAVSLINTIPSSQNYTITPKHGTNLQKLNANTKLQKLKGRRNTKIIAKTDEISNFTEAEDKILVQKINKLKLQKAEGIREAVFGIKPRSIKPALIPC